MAVTGETGNGSWLTWRQAAGSRVGHGLGGSGHWRAVEEEGGEINEGFQIFEAKNHVYLGFLTFFSFSSFSFLFAEFCC